MLVNWYRYPKNSKPPRFPSSPCGPGMYPPITNSWPRFTLHFTHDPVVLSGFVQAILAVSSFNHHRLPKRKTAPAWSRKLFWWVFPSVEVKIVKLDESNGNVWPQLVFGTAANGHSKAAISTGAAEPNGLPVDMCPAEQKAPQKALRDLRGR